MRDIETAIRACGLIRPGMRLLLAVSGGIDSVCMAHAFSRLREELSLELTLCHLDHKLRKTSADDVEWVRGLGRRLSLPVETGQVDIDAEAAACSLSVEMAARRLRYRFFGEVLRRSGAEAVATAHTADDSSESVMLHLARGAGPGGLGGIKPRVELEGARVIRPLLSVWREELAAYAADLELEWIEDESNRDPVYLRNRVRHEILPLIAARLNPGIRAALVRTASICREEDEWMQTAAAGALAQCRSGKDLSLTPLGDQPAALRRRVIQRWLLENGCHAEAIDYELLKRLDALSHGRKGSRRVPLSQDCWVVRSYDQFQIRTQVPDASAANSYCVRLQVPGEVSVARAGLVIHVETFEGIVRPESSSPGRLPAVCTIGRERLGAREIVARARRDGDRIRPLGMQGSRKLQDIFVDSRLPVDERERVPILECAGEVIWVPGYRVARGWEVPAEGAPSWKITVEDRSAARLRS